MNELLSYLNLCANVRGSMIRIRLRGIERNFSCIARKLQGLQFHPSKIHFQIGDPSVNVQGNRFFIS